MTFILILCLFGLILGLAAVASNPSPFFAAFGLVLAAGLGCGVLVAYGGSFLSLVLFLIYLGGMLVVFAYAAALAAEKYPETWGSWPVMMLMLSYVFVVVVVAGLHMGGWYGNFSAVVDEYVEFALFRGDISGVSMMYSAGGGMLMMGAWVLLLTLFVVLELTRGLSRGALRAV
uniref:NADH dehydrogenase subunit 6 n=1 Tax=Chromis acares TaxID=997966 RepID=UPI0028D1901A|nr:NADH dehydrogenase subunit 6 [Chromis acares]WMY90615.1 NADH dehydrogenase subunit 6 [Chromis acares]WNH23864.1 NADH dehydrogenase subunit 6 [Chromis acares]